MELWARKGLRSVSTSTDPRIVVHFFGRPSPARNGAWGPLRITGRLGLTKESSLINLLIIWEFQIYIEK